MKQVKKMKSIEKIKEEMNRIGWCDTGQKLDKELTEFFRNDAKRQKEKEIEKYGIDFLKNHSYLDILKCQFKFEKPYIDLLESTWVNELVDNLLNTESILYDFFILLNNESKNHNRNNFHRDQLYLGGIRASFMFLIPLVDFTHEIGPTEIINGSHLLENKPSDDFLESNKTSLIAKEGQVLLFDAACWHRAGNNTTGLWRPAIIIRYQLPFLKRFIDLTTHYADDIKKHNVSELIKKRLGFRCQEFKSLEESLLPIEKTKGLYDTSRAYYK